MPDKNETSQTTVSIEEQISSAIRIVKPYLERIWSARRKIVYINSTVISLTLLYLLFLTKPYYESTVAVLPEYGSKSSTFSGLSELASIAGVAVGEASPTEIYENLLLSEAVLEPVIYTQYQTSSVKDSVNLIQYFMVTPDEHLSSPLRERKMFLEVYRMFTTRSMMTDVDRITRILTLTVTMPESKLSAEVANNIVESLDNYVRTKRKSYASNQRFYLERRIADVKDSLTLAEEKLKQFNTTNRVVQQSPELVLEEARLMRNREILQTVYVELTKQIELVKIDEIKDTPILNIREMARDPILKTGPKRLRFLAIVSIFSIIISLTYFVFLPVIEKYVSVVRKSW